MKNFEYQIVEINPKALVVESGFNPREAVIGELCYEQEPVKSTIVSIKQAYKEGRRVDLIKVVKKGSDYLVRQGHCRYKALSLALMEGTNIQLISVILLSYKMKLKNTWKTLMETEAMGLTP